MEIQLLGPLRIVLDGMPNHVELAPKPRTVLAVLLANAGVVVPVPSLVREVWGEDPPISALRNVQTYVFQSREALSRLTKIPKRAVARELLITRPGGYVFSDQCARFDYSHYRRLAAEGYRAIRQGDCARAASLLGSALGTWRGPAFVDVPTGVALEAQRHQLEGSRLGVIEALSSAKITLGHCHEAVADLARWVFEHPLHEGLHYQYMRALSMIGDRARALDVFSRLRANLVSELGIEPGPAVQQLQCSILNSSDRDQPLTRR